MQIQPLGIQNYTDLTTGSSLQETGEKLLNPSEATLGSATEMTLSGNPKAEAFREILSDYDVTEMTPNEFSEMVSKMYDEGIISEEQYQQLSQIRVELEKAGVDSSESINLLEFYLNKLGSDSGNERFTPFFSSGPTDSNKMSDTEKTCLQWIQKLAVAGESNEIVGMDTLV